MAIGDYLTRTNVTKAVAFPAELSTGATKELQQHGALGEAVRSYVGGAQSFGSDFLKGLGFASRAGEVMLGGISQALFGQSVKTPDISKLPKGTDNKPAQAQTQTSGGAKDHPELADKVKPVTGNTGTGTPPGGSGKAQDASKSGKGTQTPPKTPTPKADGFKASDFQSSDALTNTMIGLIKGDKISPENQAMFNALSTMKKAYEADPTSLQKPEVVRQLLQSAQIDAKVFPDTQTGTIPSQASPQDKSSMQSFFDFARSETQKLLDPTQHPSLALTYTNMLKDAGVTGPQGLDEQIASLQNIMTGTKQDIRNELQQRGFPVTDSAVESLVEKRNESMTLKLEQLQNLKQAKMQYIDNMVKYYGMDEAQADARFEKALGLEETAAKLDVMMQNNDYKNSIAYQNLQIKNEVMAKNQINLAIQGGAWDQLTTTQKQDLWETAGFTGDAPPTMAKSGSNFSMPFIDNSGDLVQEDLTSGKLSVVHRATAGRTGSTAQQYNDRYNQLVTDVKDGKISADDVWNTMVQEFPDKVSNTAILQSTDSARVSDLQTQATKTSTPGDTTAGYNQDASGAWSSFMNMIGLGKK